MEELTLPLEVLLHIFGFVEPKTRISVLQTSSNIRNACLLRVWKPWDNYGRGLRRAVAKGYIGYFRRWRKLTPPGEIRWLVFSKGEDSVLVTAAAKGYLDFVKMFVKDPLAKPGGPLDPSVNNWLAFRKACAMQQTKIIRFFLTQTETDPCILEGDALLFACQNGHDKTVKVLLEDGRCDPSTLDSLCLKKAAFCGHAKVVELLLDDGRADPNAGGGLPLYYAHYYDHASILEALCLDWRIKIPKGLRKTMDETTDSESFE